MSRRNVIRGGILLLVLLLFYFASFLLTPVSSAREEVIVTVAEGTSLSGVAATLEQERLISSRRAFVLLGRLVKAERSIHVGEYVLHTRMTPLEILERLTSGAVIQIAITFPEGFTALEMAAQVEAQQLMPAEAFLTAAEDSALITRLGIKSETLEGYLFPSTYFVTRQTTPEQLVRQMVTEFQKTASQLDWTSATDQGWTRHEVVTLASMIEKETSKEDERSLVSAVFHNRLNKRMRLESDPTVIYAIDDFDGNLRKADLRAPSPYNTYVIRGLPQGPIANPGRASLEAALQPASVGYFYFVSKNDGSHVFSSTFREHQKAVAQYQLLPKTRPRASAAGKS